MKRILWLSRHRPFGLQLEELKRLFGQVEVVYDPRSFDSAQEIVGRYKKGGYDEIVVVAPLSVIAKLCELGLKPLWSQMKQVETGEEADLEYRGRRYKFERFRRIKGVKIEFEELE